MATPYRRKAKAALSNRLGFRYGRANSVASATAIAVGTKPFGSAATSGGESETSAASTLESSPAPRGESQPPREARPFTVAVAVDAHSRCRVGTGGDEAPVTPVAGTGGPQIRVAFEKDEFSSTSGKALGLTVSPAKEDGNGEALGARIDQLPKRPGAGAGAGEEVAWTVRELSRVQYNS